MLITVLPHSQSEDPNTRRDGAKQVTPEDRPAAPPRPATRLRVARYKPVWLLLAGIFWCAMASAGFGAFIGGVESFAGTELDATTWEPRFLDDQHKTITQDNALMMSTWVIGELGYSTRDVTLASGQSVWTTVTITDNGDPSRITNASLRLTSKDGSTAIHEDTIRMYVSLAEDVSRITAVVNTSGQTLADGLPSVLNTTYSLELARLSDAEMQFSAYDEGGSLLGSVTRTHPSAAELFITLSVRGGSATFEHVTIVPEPDTAALCLAAGLAMLVWFGTARTNTKNRMICKLLGINPNIDSGEVGVRRRNRLRWLP